MPTWLTQPGPVLMKNHLQHTKYHPIVQEVKVIKTNPECVYAKLTDGCEPCVSTRHLALKKDSSLCCLISSTNVACIPCDILVN